MALGEQYSLRVFDVMHPGLVSCPSETPLPVVARMMGNYRVHAVVLLPGHRADDSRGWAVVSDVDVLNAALADDFAERTAGATAATPAVTVGPDETLARAIELMTASKVTHLIVVEPGSGRPMGVVSTLDVTKVLGGFEGHPRYGRGG
jgi:CBS domain-containing protein